jgi:anti-sigma regulatory factor (Ser/Thr protein kinase)
MRFPDRPESVPLVRRFVGLVTDAYGVAHVGETAALLVSELAGNAVKHGGGAAWGRFEVVVRRRDDRLQVEVRDGSRDMPVMRYANVLDECGRGLFLVGELSDGCGRYELPDGKAVWFELTAWGHRADGAMAVGDS